MKMKTALLGLCGLVTVLLVACVTINVYFPEAAIKDISEQIEEEVAQKAAEAAEEGGMETVEPAEPAAEAEEAPPTSAGLLDIFLGTPAYADEVSRPEITNPAIRRIIDSRAARLPAIRRFKNLGVIGEGNDALLAPRDLQSIKDLKQRAEVQRLIKNENEDREQLFKAIAAAKQVDLAQLPRIRETYAGTLREDARPGDWIQLPNGQWKRK